MHKREVIMSCIGISFIEPIIHLYTKLHSLKFSGYSKTQVSSRENGYSVSIVVLCILLIESILNRIRCLEKKRENNLKFFEEKFNNPSLYNKLNEVYVLRDLIVHNHIWRISYKFDNEYNETNLYQKLLEGYGDKRMHGTARYKNNVNKRAKQTKILKLNVNPIMVNKEDVITIFKVLKEFFGFIEKENKGYFPLSNFPFEFRRGYPNFYEIIDIICEENKK